LGTAPGEVGLASELREPLRAPLPLLPPGDAAPSAPNRRCSSSCTRGHQRMSVGAIKCVGPAGWGHAPVAPSVRVVRPFLRGRPSWRHCGYTLKGCAGCGPSDSKDLPHQCPADQWPGPRSCAPPHSAGPSDHLPIHHTPQHTAVTPPACNTTVDEDVCVYLVPASRAVACLPGPPSTTPPSHTATSTYPHINTY
jgi:hypothetical protein